MIETRARVVRDAHGQLRMHGETPAACGACQVRGSCAGKDDALHIAPDAGLCDGQSVILSVREADLLRASFYAYGVPSLVLGTGMAKGHTLEEHIREEHLYQTCELVLALIGAAVAQGRNTSTNVLEVDP